MKKFSFILLIGVFAWINTYSQDMQRPKVALVLSGGGAKGFAHIGTIKVLEQEGIPIDMIVGTSMGSIVGGFYSLGYSADQIEKIVKGEDWGRLLSDQVNRKHMSQNMRIEHQRYIGSLLVNDKYEPIVPKGVVNGQNIINLFCKLASDVPKNADFTKFPIPFTCIGTNIATGKEMILDHGYLPTAIFSSMSIPGVFLPINHEGNMMLDGGLVDNFPTDIAKRMGADIIIGVDIRTDLHESKDIVSMKQLMDQLINFYSVSKDSVNKSLCNILIRPDIAGYNVYSFSAEAADTLIRRGMEAAYSKVDEIKALKQKYHLQPNELAHKLLMPDSLKITKVTLSGNYSMSDRLILDNLELTFPGTYSPDEIQDAIDKLYGLGYFKRVYFTLDDDKKGKVLNLILEEEPTKNLNLGLRVNTTNAVSIVVNFTQKDYRRFLGLVSFTADISSNPGFSFQTELSKGNLPVMGLQIDGKFNKYDAFLDKKKTFTTDLYYGAASLYTYKSMRSSSMVGLGFKQEFFIGNIYNSSVVDTFFTITKTQVGVSNLYTYFSFDNLDDYYFPGKGSEFYTEFSLVSDADYKNICPVALLKNRNIFKLTGNASFLLNIYGRAILLNEIHPYKTTFVGGAEYSPYFSNHFPFYGLPPITPVGDFSVIGLVGFQFRFAHGHYISLLGNCLLDNNEIYPFNEYATTIGTAIKYSARTKFGPVDFTAGFSGGYDKPTISANIGYWF